MTSARWFDPSSLRYFLRALNSSLKTIASAVLRDRQPLVVVVLRRTVAKVFSIGLLDLTCFRPTRTQLPDNSGPTGYHNFFDPGLRTRAASHSALRYAKRRRACAGDPQNRLHEQPSVAPGAARIGLLAKTMRLDQRPLPIRQNHACHRTTLSPRKCGCVSKVVEI